MTEYPKNIKFKYSWRKYQQRVLDDLQEHLTDGNLHVIAPPGSGKTVLGLEVAIRINKPTLILAPTIAVRNQWIQRFCELFLQTNSPPTWISRDIRNPKFMTVVTYQGLHAACNNLKVIEDETEDEEENGENGNDEVTNSNLENIISGLKLQNIKTIIVDEAHHLKNEWWHTLTSVKEKLNPSIVGLTATPPYDVTPTEWHRYIELNGHVDTEISVPELVIEGDLCPHQDYVFFTLPTEKENQNIIAFRQNIEKLFQEIRSDEILIKALENHPVWLEPTEYLDWIYDNLSYYSALLIFLHANGKVISETHLKVIGDKKLEIPKLNYEWIETVLDFYLYREKVYFKEFEEHQKFLENKLRRYGAVERRQINFSTNKRLTGFLISSISKLNGIKEIVDFEYKQLGTDLRLVILSDFIRKEFCVNTPENNVELNKIGVIPIFEKLRRENIQKQKIGVLTGSIIIIPKSSFSLFGNKAKKYGITQFYSSNLPFDDDYVLINQTEQLKHIIVSLVTEIFQCGEIEILIGTKSLLGEGWDAPAINSLVLASFVGSFMLSNQMRGRAIRTQQGNSEKTSNIWHLVCIDPTSPSGGDDFGLLKRRFRSFVGVSFKAEPGIENGIGRLNLPESINQKEEIERNKIETFAFARDRKNLMQRWKTALESGINLVEEIKIPFPEEKEYLDVKALYLRKTIANLVATLTSGLLAFGLESLEALGRAIRNIKSLEDLYFFFTVIGSIGIVIFGRLTIKTLKLYFKYRDIAKDLRQISEALLKAIIKTGAITSDMSKLKVETSVDSSGAVYCHLEGGTTFEKSVFIKALKEIIGPIDNPRYIIVRKSMFLFFINQKDYHSVPEIIGRNKELAEYFKNQWSINVGACELIFTRTIDGRQLILKSRVKSLASQFDNRIEHINKWR